MKSASEAFITALKQDHTMVTKAEITDYEGNVLHELDISGGGVSVDATASNTRSCNVTLHDESLTPRDYTDLLHPLSNNEIKPYRGVEIEGEAIYCPLGVFVLEDSETDSSNDAFSIKIKAFDRSKQVQTRRWTSTFPIESEVLVTDAIQQIIQSRIPNVIFDVQESEEVTPPLVYGSPGGGGDPWENARKLAESIGYEVFFDAEGVCVIRPVPDPKSGSAVWDYVEGPDSTLLYAVNKLSREDVFNHVVVTSTNTQLFAPIRADVVDDDPLSPTYIDGPFGDVPTFLQSQEILTVEQAINAGHGRLKQKLGTPISARFIGIVNPLHEQRDIINVKRENAGIDGRFVLDRFNIPLSYEQPMNGSCREQREVA